MSDQSNNDVGWNEELYAKCVEIYETYGQDAVLEYCVKIGHKTWGRCEPCDYDHSPIQEDMYMTCLVCGHSTYDDKQEQDVK